METILLDHVLRCCGEGIKVVVSDNAEVGKNWLTTIALPQYLVGQGLAEVAMIVFLENNHGKWLSDMLFGHLQIRRRRTTLTGVDALLSEFEAINRSDGSVQGFIFNPLASIDFNEVLKSLDYSTVSPKDFGFVKRNIHFAAACTKNAKRNLSDGLKVLLEYMLADEEGMVCTISYPHREEEDANALFERGAFDVPADAVCHSDSFSSTEILTPDNLTDAALVVAREQPHSPSGNCDVSTRNVQHVCFNGLIFRKHAGYPELRLDHTRLVKESWPPALLGLNRSECEEPLDDSFSLRCAPDSWVLRRQVSHFRSQDGDFIARYPPKNMLNAQYQQSPRADNVPGCNSWCQTTTYVEPPVPMKTCYAFWEAVGCQ